MWFVYVTDKDGRMKLVGPFDSFDHAEVFVNGCYSTRGGVQSAAVLSAVKP